MSQGQGHGGHVCRLHHAARGQVHCHESFQRSKKVSIGWNQWLVIDLMWILQIHLLCVSKVNNYGHMDGICHINIQLYQWSNSHGFWSTLLDPVNSNSSIVYSQMPVAGSVPHMLCVHGLPNCGENRPLLRLPHVCQCTSQLQRNHEVPRSHHLQPERI